MQPTLQPSFHTSSLAYLSLYSLFTAGSKRAWGSQVWIWSRPRLTHRLPRRAGSGRSPLPSTSPNKWRREVSRRHSSSLGSASCLARSPRVSPTCWKAWLSLSSSCLQLCTCACCWGSGSSSARPARCRHSTRPWSWASVRLRGQGSTYWGLHCSHRHFFLTLVFILPENSEADYTWRWISILNLIWFSRHHPPSWWQYTESWQRGWPAHSSLCHGLKTCSFSQKTPFLNPLEIATIQASSDRGPHDTPWRKDGSCTVYPGRGDTWTLPPPGQPCWSRASSWHPGAAGTSRPTPPGWRARTTGWGGHSHPRDLLYSCWSRSQCSIWRTQLYWDCRDPEGGEESS